MNTSRLFGAFALLTLPLAAQVSFTGAYTENFNSIGTATVPPAGWSHLGALGGSNSSWSATTPTPASGSVSAATAGTANNTLTVNSDAGAATATSNTQAFNFALSASTTDRCIGTSPTSGAGNILQLRLTNNSGAALTAASDTTFAVSEPLVRRRIYPVIDCSSAAMVAPPGRMLLR